MATFIIKQALNKNDGLGNIYHYNSFRSHSGRICRAQTIGIRQYEMNDVDGK